MVTSPVAALDVGVVLNGVAGPPRASVALVARRSIELMMKKVSELSISLIMFTTFEYVPATGTRILTEYSPYWGFSSAWYSFLMFFTPAALVIIYISGTISD